MSIEEIKNVLERAFHEVGHAYAYVGQARYLAASIAVDEARDSLQLAREALDEI